MLKPLDLAPAIWMHNGKKRLFCYKFSFGTICIKLFLAQLKISSWFFFTLHSRLIQCFERKFLAFELHSFLSSFISHHHILEWSIYIYKCGAILFLIWRVFSGENNFTWRSWARQEPCVFPFRSMGSSCFQKLQNCNSFVNCHTQMALKLSPKQ